jgi:hypothetical protein
MKTEIEYVTDSNGTKWIRHYVDNLVFCPPHLINQKCPICKEMEK